MVSSSWVIIFDCSIAFNKLEAVLGCLKAAGFMLLVFDVFWICLLLFLKNSSYCSLALVSSVILLI